MGQTDDEEPETEGHALSAASNLSDVSGDERRIIERHSRPNAGLLRAHLPDAPWRDLVSRLGYAVGFLVVILGRQQLFTENTLTPILPLLYNRTGETAVRVARLWFFVLVANVVGPWAVSFVFAARGVFSPEIRQAFSGVSAHAVQATFGVTVLKGIFAGWLIALLVWLLPGAGGSGAAVIVLLTWLIAVGGFTHVIAGSVDASFLVWSHQASIADYLWRFLVPTLLGNVVGGTTLVAVLNYGQVASEVGA